MHCSNILALVASVVLIPSSQGAAKSPTSPQAWDEAAAKARDFVSQLNITEKIGLVTGGYTLPGSPCVGSIGAIPRLGFNGLCFSDGPAGVARADSVSVFASGITVAASWDRRLMFERAVAIGYEFRDKGSHVHLGPSTGPLGRHALGGRNWESFGPDPYLAGVSMNASVTGIQSVGVQACSKHFIGNEQETQRSSTTSPNGIVIEAVSANIDDRTLHELYLWPFAEAVKAGSGSVMCAYNRVNGDYSCGSAEMLSILKDELAFPGYVVSDWFATHGTADFANAGLDLEMPGTIPDVGNGGVAYMGDLLLAAVRNISVSLDRLDDMAERVLRPYYLLGQDEGFPTVDPAGGAAFLVYQYGHDSPLAPLYPEVPARNVRRDHARLIHNENVTAILSAHYPGEETGNSITDVLWGLAEPSGRLPYTIPRNESDYGPPIVNLTEVPADPLAWEADFDEGQMIDYRHFDANDIEPQFEFGFGLSYTEFEMNDHVETQIISGLSANADEAKGIAPGGLNDLWTVVASVTVTVTNVGNRPGSTVPQLYVSMPQDGTPKGTPFRSLRGFDKVYLEAGETRDIQFELRRRDLSFWDMETKGWVIPEGIFTFATGFSSRDLKAETKAAVLGQGEKCKGP